MAILPRCKFKARDAGKPGTASPDEKPVQEQETERDFCLLEPTPSLVGHPRMQKRPTAAARADLTKCLGKPANGMPNVLGLKFYPGLLKLMRIRGGSEQIDKVIDFTFRHRMTQYGQLSSCVCRRG
jgi:hypothetical protein